MLGGLGDHRHTPAVLDLFGVVEVEPPQVLPEVGQLQQLSGQRQLPPIGHAVDHVQPTADHPPGGTFGEVSGLVRHVSLSSRRCRNGVSLSR